MLIETDEPVPEFDWKSGDFIPRGLVVDHGDHWPFYTVYLGAGCDGGDQALDIPTDIAKRVAIQILMGPQFKSRPGHRPEPPVRAPADPEQELRRAIVDEAWMTATESSAVPATDWADRIIARAMERKRK